MEPTPQEEKALQERHAAIKPLLDVLAAHGEFVPMPNDLVMLINSYTSPVFAFPAAFQAPTPQAPATLPPAKAPRRAQWNKPVAPRKCGEGDVVELFSNF